MINRLISHKEYGSMFAALTVSCVIAENPGSVSSFLLRRRSQTLLFTIWWWCQMWERYICRKTWKQQHLQWLLRNSGKGQTPLPPSFLSSRWRLNEEKAWCHLAKWFIVILLKWLAVAHCLSHCCQSSFSKDWFLTPYTQIFTCIHFPSKPPPPPQLSLYVPQGEGWEKRGRGGKRYCSKTPFFTTCLYTKSQQKTLQTH